MRSFLRFIIGLREVLPHDADAEQLNRANEDDHTHGGCPAGDRIAEAQPSDDDNDQHDRRHECHPDSRPGCDAERHLREIDDAVKCILQQLPEVPLRFPGHLPRAWPQHPDTEIWKEGSDYLLSLYDYCTAQKTA